MDKFVILKNKDGKYYADGDFTQTEKKFADKLRVGQANRIAERLNRYNSSILSFSDAIPYVTIEEISD